MNEKECFKCGRLKSLDEFYRHPRMADGHLGKCIECAKSDVAKRAELKSKDPNWMREERERCRIKQEAYRQAGLAKKSLTAGKKWSRNNRHKSRANGLANYAVRSGKIPIATNCNRCGATGRLEKHHEDYSKPLEVEWLCTKCHGKTRRKDK